MADEELAVRGIENVCAALSRAPALIVKNCFADALLAGAAPIAQELYVECPVSAKNELFDDETFTVLKGTGTGKMKSKIVADVRIDPAGRGGDLQVGFGNQGFKARMVEYGHRCVTHWAEKILVSRPGKRHRYRKSGGHEDTGKTAAPNPFMGRAAASSAAAAIEAFDVTLAASLEQHLKDL
ncbi:MAG: hypothetical protein ABSB88_05925 [Bryobacteraceae bacterium]|jgi:hypothetical protein